MSFVTITTVADHQRGLRYRAGRLTSWLEPGRHWSFWPGEGSRDELLDLESPVSPWTPELAAVAPHGSASTLEVPFRSVALISVDGRPTTLLGAGRWLLWQLRHRVEAAVHDLAPLRSTVPEAAWHLLPAAVATVVVALPHERVVAYVDGVCAEVLAAGRHAIHVEGRAVALVRVDLREQELTIPGQEVMTADKVSLRATLLLRYRVTDPLLTLSSVVNVRDALYGEAQMAARRLIASVTLDALLEGRNGLAATVLEQVAGRAKAWGVAIEGLDLKDLVLPGDMRTMLNQVIEAEKRAAAQVILRREETAATRSLANTARLLEQNPVLLRLKELESMERLAEKVGSFTVVAAPEQWLSSLRLNG